MCDKKSVSVVSANRKACLSCIVLAFFIIAGCSSPLLGKQEKSGKAQFTLNFLISGMNHSVMSSNASTGDSASRLILPTANTLTVTLIPSGGGGVSQTRTVSIAIAQTVVPMDFSDIRYGDYTVSAMAFAPDGTTVLFQTKDAPLTVDASSVSVMLNLVPATMGTIPDLVLTGAGNSSFDLPATQSVTWQIPAGSELLNSSYLAFGNNQADVLLFIQKLDGTSLGTGVSANVLISSGITESVYVTFYNSNATSRSVGFCPSPVMIAVPSGTFQRDATAKNTSYVSAFSIGKYEVTQAQYLAVMGINPSGYSSADRLSHPAEKMNHYECLVFCNRLSILEGLTPVYSILVGGTSTVDTAAWINANGGVIPQPGMNNAIWNAATAARMANGYRLPTEAEWEWAAMGATAGTTGYLKAFAGSTGSVSDNAWTSANSTTTQAVGSRNPNELGLFDMSGNVYEKCWDWFDGTSYTSGAFVNPDGKLTIATSNISRGGAFTKTASEATVANRPTPTSSDAIWADVGIRVARGVIPPQVFAYVPSKTGRTISVFRFNQFTGTLTLEGTVVATNPERIAIDPKNRFAFTANGSDNTVSAFTINPANAAHLIEASFVAAGTNPTDIVVDESGKYVYASNQGSKNISAFKYDQFTGVLTKIDEYSTAAEGTPLSIAVEGNYLYCVSYFVSENAGAIQSFLINSDGTLGVGINASYNIGVNQNGIAIQGNYLYIGEGNSPGASSILFNPANGAIISAVPGGATPNIGWPVPDSVCMDPLGQYFFLPIGTNTLWRIPFTQSTGAFGTAANSGINAIYAAFDPTETFVLGLNGTTLTSYALNRSNGNLSSTGFTAGTDTGANSIVMLSVP